MMRHQIEEDEVVGSVEQKVLETLYEFGSDDELTNAIAAIAREVDEQKIVLNRSLGINARGLSSAAKAIEALERRLLIVELR